jgi:PDZ domain
LKQQENVDVCAVDEEPLSIRVTLQRPFGLGLEEKDDSVAGTGGVIVDSIVPGSSAEKSNLIAIGDTLSMVSSMILTILCVCLHLSASRCAVQSLHAPLEIKYDLLSDAVTGNMSTHVLPEEDDAATCKPL